MNVDWAVLSSRAVFSGSRSRNSSAPACTAAPSLGVGDYTGIFHAGRYNDAWLYSKWLQHGGPKYIHVDATGFRESDLLECRWWQKARNGKWKTGIQKFEPGDFEVRPPARDFLNDVFGEVRMPEDATATLWENSGNSGRYTTFERRGTYKLADYELSHRVSSLSFKRDDWKEVSQRLGELRERRELGNPISLPFKSTGLAGAVLHPTINLGRTRDEETNWHVDQRVGISATIGTGESSPVKAEFTVSTETEAGGRGRQDQGLYRGHRNHGRRCGGR